MKPKLSYKIKNWSTYNCSLINRGNLTLWISDDAIVGWYAKPFPKGRGRHFTYSDAAIELGLTLRGVFKFPLRATQGFLEGLCQMLKLDLKVPCYSQLSRRAAKLNINLSRIKTGDKIDLVIDSTGLKIYGEVEWKMRTHGKQKRRTWRKYHVAVDPKTHEVVAVELTHANVHDSLHMPKLVETAKLESEIGTIFGDGAYITKRCFDSIAQAKAKAKIPIRTGTCIARGKVSDGLKLRNELIREIRAADGKVFWKKTSGYHKRSLVETHMFRLKTILGGTLSSRLFENQKTEARIKAKILNRYTNLGMPETIKL